MNDPIQIEDFILYKVSDDNYTLVLLDVDSYIVKTVKLNKKQMLELAAILANPLGGSPGCQ